eukprot:CAMPEP_0117774968 /NCGR_PEP_ID=MMETSP0947-20121206/26845_1 /TAXON_ID=44440 /ORGANISM="Chattonella subsalsa, Strain CCMP2191" /LENGTH=426 /DNA_ID=CAMNT_0005601559 /DNA_START=25 /DNA_END=1304 /DNA_ORIENTATION=-
MSQEPSKDDATKEKHSKQWQVLFVLSVWLLFLVMVFLAVSLYRLTEPAPELEQGGAAESHAQILEQARLLVKQELASLEAQVSAQQEVAYHLQSLPASTDQKLGALHQQILAQQATMQRLKQTSEQSSSGGDNVRAMIAESQREAAKVKQVQTDVLNQIKTDQECSGSDPTEVTAAVNRQSRKIDELEASLYRANMDIKDAVKTELLENSFSEAQLPSSPEAMVETAEEHLQAWVQDVVDSQVGDKQCANRSEVEEMMQGAVNRFEADRVGLPDLAVRTAGGKIISARGLTSPSYTPQGALISTHFWHLLGMENGVGPPEDVITQDTSVGRCWAFSGSRGRVTIQLSRPAQVTAVSLEHVPKVVALDVSSAPKKFRVWGLESIEDGNGTLLGTFEYSFEDGFFVDPNIQDNGSTQAAESCNAGSLK